jgi:hypothetical protein
MIVQDSTTAMEFKRPALRLAASGVRDSMSGFDDNARFASVLMPPTVWRTLEAQPPRGDLCHEAPTPAVARKPLVSYRINRELSGWILPPLMIRAFGAH